MAQDSKACNLTPENVNPNVINPLKLFLQNFDPKFKEINIQIEENPEIYIFDHGNSTYYKTTDDSPLLTSQKLVSKSQNAAVRFWAEIFSSIHIGITFVTSFLLQLLKFLMVSTLRPLTVGVIQLTSDYLIKPVLSITFNGLVQPVLIFLLNVATSVRDVCKPLAEALGFFLLEISNLCRAFRFVEVKH
ncbi:Protein of unknown function [Cotesia congregata]|uniref:Uncharacterized protein n=1 Tax=Cotesia congregata TaxID=51543 RepID=A0A8J2H3I0_COTCN|nr:Protein of unknown function [Cotesia congregata]